MPLEHLLRTDQLTPGDLQHVLDLAWHYQLDPFDHPDRLRGRVGLAYFNKPSLRTRLSWTTAISHLGGTPMVVNPGELQLDRGESIEDTSRVVSRMASVMLIRTFADADLERFAAASDIPIINGLTDGHHPCQSIADLLTIRKHLGHLRGLKIAYLGDGCNTAVSLAQAAALAGASITLACPSGFQPSDETMLSTRHIADQTGSEIVITDNPREAVRGANVVYTDTWMSMGIGDDEKANRFEALRPFQVTRALMDATEPGSMFLHCLPAHRGEEVMPDVIDGPQSFVFDQAEHRVSAVQAIIVALLDGELQGSGL
jgi:ornithine carbamoyltransferase